MEIKGIFFDLNGTLLSYGNLDKANQDHEDAIYIYFTERSKSISREKFDFYVKNYFDIQTPEEFNQELSLFEYKLQQLAFQVELSLNEDELHELAMRSIRAWEVHHPLDNDSHRILNQLQSQYKIALITDFDHPPYIHHILHKYNLNKFFKIIVISADVGVKKPHPEMFNKALEEAQLSANEVVYVGDSVEHDICGALNVGMIPIQIDRAAKKNISKDFSNKWYKISGLNSLPKLLTMLQKMG